MSGEFPIGSSRHDDRVTSAREGRDAAIRQLDWFGKRIHEQLDALEAQIRQRPAAASRTGGLTNSLQRRIAELEDIRAGLQAEVDRLRRERDESIELIEHDRLLLAEAWETLEREQLTGTAASNNGRAAQAVEPPGGYSVPSNIANGRDDLVSREILRQFQSLHRDVRRNAQNGRPGRT